MRLSHVRVQVGCKHKGGSAVVLLASQLWRSVSMSKVVLKILFASELLSTSILFAIETPLEVHKPDMIGQTACGVKHSSALGIVADQLLLPMSCRALVHLQ